MNKSLLLLGALGMFIVIGLFAKKYYVDPNEGISIAQEELDELAHKNVLQEGDIIFQTSRSSQSKAIQLATNSPYSHCGLIYLREGNLYVFEAIQTVSFTPLDVWVARGEGGKFAVKRLKSAEGILTGATLQKMKLIGDDWLGKSYDPTFEWSDDKLYCSELIWKIYQRGANIEIGQLQRLRDFNLSNEIVKRQLHERYYNNIPLDEQVISPISIFESDLLTTVKANY